MDFSALLPYLIVALGGLFAGAMNGIAGGGTFFSFPALLAAGVPPIMASASNSVALCPASASSAWAYRREIARHGKIGLYFGLMSMFGGLAGGCLLLSISNAAFSTLIPWLMLVATALFAFSGHISRVLAWIKRVVGLEAAISTPGSFWGLLFQFVVGIYGGFFGAGMGILTLAALSIQGFKDVQEMNGLRNLTSTANYTVASLTFIIAGAVSWPHTLTMLVTASLGGYSGAMLARKMPAKWWRALVITVGAVLTLVYFFKVYG